MGNWMEKFENRQEETYENKLNNELDSLIDLVDNSREYNEKDMEKALTRIVKIYEELKSIGLKYDEKDMVFRKKQLVELRFIMKKREYMGTKEESSWNEFEEEEQERYDEEER